MFRTMDEMWMNAVSELLQRGHETTSRVGKTKELLGYSETLTHVQQTFLLNKQRRLSPAYAAAEVLWYLSGTNTIDMIRAYAPQYHKFAEDGVAHGAYGHRWKHATRDDQFELLTELLQKSPDSRQAVVTMWKADDLWHCVREKRKDIPCTLSLQFLVREGKLHLVTTMRSNDAWLGLPYDVFAFTCLQWLVASVLGVEPGAYTHQAGSMHLYEKNWKAAEEAIKSDYPSDFCRLEHEWNYDIPENWQRCVDRAIRNENQIRTMTSVPRLFPINVMLRDLVLCCATKWIDWGHLPHSPVLLEAIKNADAKK